MLFRMAAPQYFGCVCHCLYWHGCCVDCVFVWCCIITYPCPSCPLLVQYCRYDTLSLQPKISSPLPEWTFYVWHSTFKTRAESWMLYQTARPVSTLVWSQEQWTAFLNSLESYYFGLCGNVREIAFYENWLDYVEILVSDCTGGFQNDNFQRSRWWEFRRSDDVFISVYSNGSVVGCPYTNV